MKSDIQIAQQSRLLPIVEVAEKIGIPAEDLELYGKYKAKVPLSYKDRDISKSKLILVSAISAGFQPFGQKCRSGA